MNYLFHLFMGVFIFTLSFQGVAQVRCADLLKSEKSPLYYKEDHEHIYKISSLVEKISKDFLEPARKLRWKIDFWRNLFGKRSRVADFKAELKLENFVFELSQLQDVETAAKNFQMDFMNVEESWVHLQLHKLKTENKNLNIKSYSQKEIDTYQNRFIKSFTLYVSIRLLLEKIIAGEYVHTMNDNSDVLKNSKIVESAKELMIKLGWNAVVDLKTENVLKRPEVEEIVEYLRSNPDLFLKKLKNDLRIQRKYSLKAIPSVVTQSVQEIVLHLFHNKLKPYVSILIGMNYDFYMLNTFLDDISAVVKAPNNYDFQRFEVLRTLSAKKNTNDFLETFARITYFTSVWQKLMTDAVKLSAVEEANSGSTLYKSFLEKMKQAEERAKVKEALSPFYQPTVLDHLQAWAPFAVVGSSLDGHYDLGVTEKAGEVVKDAGGIVTDVVTDKIPEAGAYIKELEIITDLIVKFNDFFDLLSKLIS